MSANAVSVYSALIGMVIIVAIIAAIVLLTWHGSVTGEAAISILSALVGGGVVGGVQHVAVKLGANAASNQLN